MGPTGPTGADGTSCYLANNTPFSVSDSVLVQESGCNNGGSINTYACTDDVTYNTYTCNGNDGTDGSNGFNALSNTLNEPAGANCATGGLRVDVGLDINTNNVLDNSEITNTSYVCNGNDGSNGFNALSNTLNERAGANCATGGLRVDVGLDINTNNVLDNSEITNTSYVCNGNDGNDGSNGFNTLSNLSAEPIGSNCSNGGTKIDIGLDTNRNNILDSVEITDTSYVCNADGVPPPQSLCVVGDTRPECTSGLWRIRNLQFSNTFGEFWRGTYSGKTSSSYVHGFTSAIRYRFRNWTDGNDWCSTNMTWANGAFTGGSNTCTDGQGRYAYTSVGWARISGTNTGVKISTDGTIQVVNGATHDPANRRICFLSGGESCVSYNIEWELIP